MINDYNNQTLEINMKLPYEGMDRRANCFVAIFVAGFFAFVAIKSFTNSITSFIIFLILSIFCLYFAVRLLKYKMKIVINKKTREIKCYDNMPIKQKQIYEKINEFNVIRLRRLITHINKVEHGSDEISYGVELSKFNGDILAAKNIFLEEKGNFPSDEELRNEDMPYDNNVAEGIIKKIAKNISNFNKKCENPIICQLNRSKNFDLSFFSIRGDSFLEYMRALNFAERIADFLEFPIIDETSDNIEFFLPNNKDNIKKLPEEYTNNKRCPLLKNLGENFFDKISGDLSSSEEIKDSGISVSSHGDSYLIKYKYNINIAKVRWLSFIFISTLSLLIIFSMKYIAENYEYLKNVFLSFDSISDLFFYKQKYFRSKEEFYNYFLYISIPLLLILTMLILVSCVILEFFKNRYLKESIMIEKEKITFFRSGIFLNKKDTFKLSELLSIRLTDWGNPFLMAVSYDNIIQLGKGLNKDFLNNLRNQIILCIFKNLRVNPLN